SKITCSPVRNIVSGTSPEAPSSSTGMGPTRRPSGVAEPACILFHRGPPDLGDAGGRFHHAARLLHAAVEAACRSDGSKHICARGSRRLHDPAPVTHWNSANI